MTISRTYSKKELRNALEIGRSTMSRYLNELYFEELQKLGYYSRQKILTPKQVQFLCDKLGLEVPA